MERNNLPISILQSFQSLSLSTTTIDFGKEFASNKTPEEIVAAINLFLQLHTSNKVDKFYLYFSVSKKFLPDIENWVSYAVNKGVEEVHLDFSMAFGDSKEEFIDEVQSLPTSLFKCETLTNLSLSYCNFSPPPDFAGFEYLQSISLNLVNITGDIFQQLIANCPLLDNLSISMCPSLDTIKLSSDRLRILTIVNPGDADAIEISAPRLESFIYYGVHIFGDSEFDPSDSFLNISSLSDAFILGEGSSEPEHDFIKLVYDLRHVKVLTVCSHTLWVLF